MFKKIGVTATLLLIPTQIYFGQPKTTRVSLGTVSRTALAYFEKSTDRNLDDYLRSIRPAKLAPNLKLRVLSMLRQEDIVTPTPERSIKLAALDPILRYHDRSATIDPKIIRVKQAAVMFLAGAAVLISEEALDMLTTEELQAVVAHELGHEYFWNEYEEAQKNNGFEKLQELELRCDGLAVITMNSIGIDPECLITGIAKLTKSHTGTSLRADHYAPMQERINFIRAMIELVNARKGATAVTGI